MIVFVDTNILEDYLRRADTYPCSVMFLDKVASGHIKGLTSDFVLSELLGILKGEREKKLGLEKVKREVLSKHDKEVIDESIRLIRQNIKSAEIPEIEHEEIYETVLNLCVTVKDAMVLQSARKLREKIKEDTCIVSRDDRMLYRGWRLMPVFFPSHFIDRCPSDCVTPCNYRKV
mgnify:CR=1 FL=1